MMITYGVRNHTSGMAEIFLFSQMIGMEMRVDQDYVLNFLPGR